MTTEILPFVSVQADWDQVVREVASNTIPSGSFWIACYLKGKESVQGSVEVNRTKDYEITLEGKDDVVVTNLNSRAFKVECPKLGIKDITVYSSKQEFSLIKDKPVNCLDISPNGQLFAASHESKASIGSIMDGNISTVLEGHVSDVTTVEFFPSNLVVLTGGADFQLKIWSVLDGSNPVTLKGHTSAITNTAIISKGRNVLSSSRDGTIKLWNCGTSSTITTMGNYKVPVNKIILTQLPSQYEAAPIETLDPMEVETSDKLVLAALDDGSVRGIHLGTKEEIFAIPTNGIPLTAIAFDQETEIIFIGNKDGFMLAYSLKEQKIVSQWKRNGYMITSIVIMLNKNGEKILCISSADGSVYQTASLTNTKIQVEAELTGNELEAVYDMKLVPTKHESGYQRVACAVRDGKIRIY
ncbi:WD40-repeat-containing domain protein [Cokeromyces recurvatus]|uniref:WD40-repeat-containing domain protein n=1 Tax=Cokeromyces recurvatus TaxID=90255 RepID=UPI002220D6FC|nr:WD40-repeat-containing domain protein [Cokeromyces recurvatus]KAI7902093.1 WD40-repeat-containing domain protein [Cokeromyces recurvatus]